MKTIAFARITILILGISLQLYAQNIEISGHIKNTTVSVRDSIYFFLDNDIPSQYYKGGVMSSFIVDSNFSMNNNLIYPHLYFSIFKKDKGKLLSNPKLFFIDSSTKNIVLDVVSWENSYTDGDTGQEFETNFKNYVRSNLGEIPIDYFFNNPFLSDLKFDSLTLNYTKHYPESFIPLWFLIYRYYLFGFEEIRANHLDEFGDKIKQTKVWKMIKYDIEHALIKNGNSFPKLNLVDTIGNEYVLDFPKNKKYILLDFWFSSCKPCLASFPKLLAIYDKYKDKGFEVVGISVDRYKAKERWLTTIKQNVLPWQQLWDIGGVVSKKLIIRLFPRYILLDSNGKIINSRISLAELEEFLAKKG